MPLILRRHRFRFVATAKDSSEKSPHIVNLERAQERVGERDLQYGMWHGMTVDAVRAGYGRVIARMLEREWVSVTCRISA